MPTKHTETPKASKEEKKQGVIGATLRAMHQFILAAKEWNESPILSVEESKNGKKMVYIFALTVGKKAPNPVALNKAILAAALGTEVSTGNARGDHPWMIRLIAEIKRVLTMPHYEGSEIEVNHDLMTIQVTLPNRKKLDVNPVDLRKVVGKREQAGKPEKKQEWFVQEELCRLLCLMQGKLTIGYNGLIAPLIAVCMKPRDGKVQDIRVMWTATHDGDDLHWEQARRTAVPARKTHNGQYVEMWPNAINDRLGLKKPHKVFPDAFGNVVWPEDLIEQMRSSLKPKMDEAKLEVRKLWMDTPSDMIRGAKFTLAGFYMSLTRQIGNKYQAEAPDELDISIKLLMAGNAKEMGQLSDNNKTLVNQIRTELGLTEYRLPLILMTRKSDWEPTNPVDLQAVKGMITANTANGEAFEPIPHPDGNRWAKHSGFAIVINPQGRDDKNVYPRIDLILCGKPRRNN
jgi:hypothetical protein